MVRSNVDKLAQAMRAEMNGNEEIFQPSIFWSDLNQKNEAMIAAEGLTNFKRTLSQNYFNWLIADEKHPYHEFVRHRREAWILRTFSTLREMDHLRLTSHEGQVAVTAQQRESYKQYVCHVWSIMQLLDKHRLHRRVSEPQIGNPFPVKFLGRRLSQDLATSIIECNTLVDLAPPKSRYKVAELGAGYGRLGYVFASTQPGLYCIFNIPPALAVAQWYAEQIFDSRQIFKFRSFKDFREISSELDSRKLAFFTPNQLRSFPENFFDTFVTISTLPEMRTDQVNLYLKEFQRLSSRHIFIKQWKHWKNPSDGTDLDQNSYNLGAEWSISREWDDPVIPDFFNRIWKRAV